jgi:hypothetical protein
VATSLKDDNLSWPTCSDELAAIFYFSTLKDDYNKKFWAPFFLRNNFADTENNI